MIAEQIADELTSNNVYLQRLIALREFGFPLAEQREREGRLNYRLYMRSCGAAGCVLGWWVTTAYAQAEGWSFKNYLPTWNSDSHYPAEAYFGLTIKDWEALFTVDDRRTLADRRARLDELIAARMGAGADAVNARGQAEHVILAEEPK